MHVTAQTLVSAGLTKLELNTITGPTAVQYDDMLEALTNLQHLLINKVIRYAGSRHPGRQLAAF